MDDVTVTDPVACEAPVTEGCGSSCEATTEAVATEAPAVEEAPVAEAVAPAEAEMAAAT